MWYPFYILWVVVVYAVWNKTGYYYWIMIPTTVIGGIAGWKSGKLR